MKMLLAGPGTGKTTKVKTIIKENYLDAENILVLSFTNATVNDLTESFADHKNISCYTLHSYALVINHLIHRHILDDFHETSILERYSAAHDIEFEKLCYFLNCITFDEMIISCQKFLVSNPEYGKEKIGNLDLLIVDEFQDFNLAERELIYELSKYAKETIILGDDDQSIYGFKDAAPEGIIELFNRKDVERISHENKCYRCPDKVVDYSKKLIGKNSRRVDKPWFKTGRAGEIIFKQIMSQEETNKFIVSEIKDIQKKAPHGSILVLSPVKYYVENLIELLKSESITVVDFWTSKIDLVDIMKIWWLKAIFTEEKLLNMTFIANTSFTAHFRKKYNQIMREALQSDFDEQKVIKLVVDMFPAPFNAYLLNSPDIAEFMSSHNEFAIFNDHINYEDVTESLKSVFKKINPNAEFEKDSVNVMSIHKSKGLQADYVFITGMVDGVLPNKVKGLDTIEAQRRLLFVGMTRTLSQLYMISQVEWEGKYVNKLDKSQFIYNYRKKQYAGKASNFISEMIE
ncbi:MAG: ATP-dependent helicase [Chloroflexi bacterium]|nr:ATP-dependent helicase [Chloroflexota bacterium]